MRKWSSAWNIWDSVKDSLAVPNEWTAYWFERYDKAPLLAEFFSHAFPGMFVFDDEDEVGWEVLTVEQSMEIRKRFVKAKGISLSRRYPNDDAVDLPSSIFLLASRYPENVMAIRTLPDAEVIVMTDIAAKAPYLSWDEVRRFVDDGIDIELIDSLMDGRTTS
jgi:hypothetical protein